MFVSSGDTRLKLLRASVTCITDALVILPNKLLSWYTSEISVCNRILKLTAPSNARGRVGGKGDPEVAPMMR